MIQLTDLFSRVSAVFHWCRSRHRATAWAFDQRCLLCETFTRTPQGMMITCSGCYQDFFPVDPRCRRCSKPIPAGIANWLCGICLKTPSTASAITQVFCPTDYLPPLSTLIHRAKFQGRIDTLTDLGHLFSGWVNQALLEGRIKRPDILVPVPLHTTRLRDRGFNQSVQLATAIGKATGIDVNTKLVARHKNTPPQSTMNQAARRRNVKGAFSVAQEKFPNKHVVLIDDVFTTGSTTGEIAACLRACGTDRVDVWALALAHP